MHFKTNAEVPENMTLSAFFVASKDAMSTTQATLRRCFEKRWITFKTE